jgi:hypothetical protein
VQLGDRFCGNNNVGFVAARELQLNVDHRKPPAICGHERKLVVLETEENAVQHVAGLVCRYGVGSLS